MAGFTQPAYRLEPAEDLFHPFPLALTECVPRMASGALVNDTGLLARKMRGHSMLAHFLNQLFAVVTFVGAQCDPLPARQLLHHRECRLRFSPSGGLRNAAVDREPLAILHQHMCGIAELRLLAFTLARQQRFRIGGGLVGIVGALLAMKVHGGNRHAVRSFPRRHLCA